MKRATIYFVETTCVEGCFGTVTCATLERAKRVRSEALAEPEGPYSPTEADIIKVEVFGTGTPRELHAYLRALALECSGEAEFNGEVDPAIKCFSVTRTKLT